MGFPMMEIPVTDKKGGNSDTQVMWDNWVHLFILRGFLLSLQITGCMNNNRMWSLLAWLGVGSSLPNLPNLPNSCTTIKFLKITHHFNLQYLENGIYCLLHWLLSSFSAERVYPAQPGPVLEFFKYPDPARLYKTATRSTSKHQTPTTSTYTYFLNNCSWFYYSNSTEWHHFTKSQFEIGNLWLGLWENLVVWHFKLKYGFSKLCFIQRVHRWPLSQSYQWISLGK